MCLEAYRNNGSAYVIPVDSLHHSVGNITKNFYDSLNNFMIIYKNDKKKIITTCVVSDTRHPDFECFGNNLTEITNSVFDVTSRESNYKSVLSKLSKTMSFEQVMAAFGNDLSLNAMIFLKQCYKGDDSL